MSAALDACRDGHIRSPGFFEALRYHRKQSMINLLERISRCIHRRNGFVDVRIQPGGCPITLLLARIFDAVE
jgi:hypothetical protein